MNESQFLTEIRHSFEDMGSFAYKIPDSANMRGKFTLAKPFDMVAEVNGQLIAIEGKVQLNGRAWSIRTVRDTQKLGLSKVESFGNPAFIFLCWKKERGFYELIIIPFHYIKMQFSFSKKDLINWPFKVVRDNKKCRYNLTEVSHLLENGLT